MTEHAPPAVLRDRAAPDHGKVNFAELFFDLVFVFAVTRLSHGLIAHPTLEGALETAFLGLAMWVVWMWSTWAMNWLDGRSSPVRLMLFAVMGLGLVMSVSIPEAFGDRGLIFAVAYALMHNVRNAFTVWALKDGEPAHRTNFIRIQAWLLLSGAFWIAGGLAEGEARWALWLMALALEVGAPWWGFWTPGLGKSTTADWTVDAAHMAERCGLFVILSLGESIIILGATFADLEWTGPAGTAFATGFVGAVAMWWVYFKTAAEAAEHRFAAHDDSGRVARAAYTYAHIPLVAGVILTAVADELVLAHPTGHIDGPTLWSVLLGPSLFLAGSALFNRMICGSGYPLSHILGIAALLLGAFAKDVAPPVALGVYATLVLIAVGAWETFAPTNRSHAAACEAAS